MKTTKRFEEAITKLYKAFHDGTLELYDCLNCAVGNICNNTGEWYDILRSSKKGYNMYNNPLTKYDICNMPNEILKFGYSSFELATIENIFANNCNCGNDNFKGLCAVVEYLAELDNIPNPMDYSKLFETENNTPKYELIF
jgi:hypothetical protein